jgi:hypothetical protein
MGSWQVPRPRDPEDLDVSNAPSGSAGRIDGDHEGSSRSASSAGGPAEDPRTEAERIVELATAAGVPMRVIGGVAVSLRCPSARRPPLLRAYRDIDFAARSADGRRISALFTAAGYEPDAEFNALHGRQRMFFWDPGNRREADVFLDRFAMCHTIDFRERLELAERTLPLPDLLLFKLQVVETNDKDYKDAIALLVDHPLTPDGIDAPYIASFLSGDWGWWRTVTVMLDRMEDYVRELPQLSQRDPVTERIRGLLDAIHAEPKTGRWKLRARIGERKRWYDIPEEAHQ